MVDNKILVITGFSGAGKDALYDVMKSEYNTIVSHTTRPMREGESEGNPYYFITKEKMMTIYYIFRRLIIMFIKKEDTKNIYVIQRIFLMVKCMKKKILN